MGDSDDDIFWGRVTKHEWQVISNRFLQHIPSVRETHTDHISGGLEPNKPSAQTCKLSNVVIQRSNSHSSIDELVYNQEKNVSLENVEVNDSKSILLSSPRGNDSSCDSGVVLPETVVNKVSIGCHEMSFDTNFKNKSVSSIDGADGPSDCVTNYQVNGEEYSDITNCTKYGLEIKESSSHTNSYLLLEECVKESNLLHKDIDSNQKYSVDLKKGEVFCEEKKEQIINLNSVNDSSDCHSAGQFAISNCLSKPSCSTDQSCKVQDIPISNLSGMNSKENRYSSKESEHFFLSNKLQKESYEAIEGETDSILCETLNDNSSEESYGLNDTFEEMGMVMKYGLNYVCSGDDVNPSQQSVTKTNFIQNYSQPDDLKCAANRIPFGSKLDSIQNSGEDRVLTQCSKKKHMMQGNTAGDTKNRLTTPTSQRDMFKCPKFQSKKGLNFSKIRSPVAEYIKHRPVQLLKTATKDNNNVKGNCIPAQNLLVKEECSPIQQRVLKSGKCLPVIKYEKAPVINLFHQGSVERNIPTKALHGIPKMIKHTGRAVLATVPPNALQMKHAEVSMIYDKDVSQTSTL